MLAEYLATYHEAEVLLHETPLDRGLPLTEPLPAMRGEGPEQAERRARYNRVRTTPPLLQQLLSLPSEPADSRGHRLTWTGEVVQQTFDYYNQRVPHGGSRLFAAGLCARAEVFGVRGSYLQPGAAGTLVSGYGKTSSSWT